MSGAELRTCLAAILALWRRTGPLILSGLRSVEREDLEYDLGTASARVERGGFTALGFISGGSAPRTDHATNMSRRRPRSAAQ
jgi:hypothetical protein